MKENLFRKTSIEKISSPEQLDDYIKVSNPGVWLVLAAVFIILASSLVWAVLGTLKMTSSASGVKAGSEIVCYIAPRNAASIQTGMKVEMDGKEAGVVSSVSNMPITAESAREMIGNEYYADSIDLPAWSVCVEVNVAPESAEDGVVNVTIVEQEIRPVDFLFG